MDNLSTRTPAEIDTEIARINSEISRYDNMRDQAQDTLNRIDGLDNYERRFPWNSQEKYDEAVATVAHAADMILRLVQDVAPLHDEYRRRPWTRFYLVTNTGGHVHSSTSCDTCFVTTSFAWLTEQSGMSHDDLVEMAGEQACTVCFPNAPVDVLKRKSRLETPDRKAARLEREQKRAAKEAAQVTVENYVEYSGPRTKVFKTERAATNAIAEQLSSLCWYGPSHPSAHEWDSNIRNTRTALAAKGVEYDYDKALAAARKKVTKQGGEPKF